MPTITNDARELDKLVQWLNAATVKFYGPIIYDHILKGNYAWLRDYLIISKKDMRNDAVIAEAIRRFHGMAGYEWKEKSEQRKDKTWVSVGSPSDSPVSVRFYPRPRQAKTPSAIAEGAFEAYLVYMSTRNFYYISTGGAPEGSVFHTSKISSDHAYEIFFRPDKPSGNCTAVNQGFLTLLQFLGFHPARLALRSVGADDADGEAFVITRNTEKLAVLKSNGIIDATYEKYLRLPAYVSNALRLLDLECKVGKSDYETPFPNHQFAEIIDAPNVFRFWDARNGLRYKNTMGIFEFWETQGEILYRHGGQEVRAKVVWGDNPRELVVESSAYCHRSVSSVTKRPIRSGERDAAWFYMNEDEPYGSPTTTVRWTQSSSLMLPRLVASSYGYFIPDAEVNTIHTRVRAGLDAYDGRILAKRSEESKAMAETLRSIVGGGKNSVAVTTTVPADQMRDIVYGLLGTTEPVDGYPPLKRNGKLFEKLADALGMPKVLRT